MVYGYSSGIYKFDLKGVDLSIIYFSQTPA